MTGIAADCCPEFAADYELTAHPAFRALERRVLGCDYGGTSWTTRSQADGMAQALGLGRGSHLLELGSGSGWPALHLAQTTDCRVTLLDLPINALAQARDRARSQGTRAADTVVASGAALPFLSASFDALAHSDVLCCLPDKLDMLMECRRVARPGAPMAFYVIAPGGGLNKEELAMVAETGPPFVETPADYPTLLTEAGWNLLARESVDTEYIATLRRLLEGLTAEAETFIGVMGSTEYRETLARRERQVAVVENGLMKRERFLARAG